MHGNLKDYGLLLQAKKPRKQDKVPRRTHGQKFGHSLNVPLQDRLGNCHGPTPFQVILNYSCSFQRFLLPTKLDQPTGEEKAEPRGPWRY